MFRNFFCSLLIFSKGLIMSASIADIAGYYWIDDGPLTPFSSTSFEVPVDMVSEGLHVLNIFVLDSEKICSNPLSSVFF